MTLAEYLQVLDNYVFSDQTLERVVAKCNSLYGFTISGTGTAIDTLTEEELDLCEAWAWVAALGIVRVTSGSHKTIGNRSMTSPSLAPTQTDKDVWLNMANRLFRKYSYPEITVGGDFLIDDYTAYWQ